MRWTQTLIPTSKESPAEAQIASHQLLLRAGLAVASAPGVFTLLPLGQRIMARLSALVRDELSQTAATEVSLPLLQPLDHFKATGRDVSLAEITFRTTDRHGRELLLAGPPEEALAQLAATFARSYRQFPLSLYQIRTQLRDEYRPRLGLLRAREVHMLDLCTFHTSVESLLEATARIADAFQRILSHCGLHHRLLSAETGQSASIFIAPAEVGDDLLFTSDQGNYAATLEHCRIGARPWDLSGQPAADLQQVHTPGMHSIDEVAGFLKVPPSQILKTLVFATIATEGAAPRWVVAVVRGDHDVNEAKLARMARERFNCAALRKAEDTALHDEFAIGFVGPDEAIRNNRAVMVIDIDAAQDQPWVAGANEVDYHVVGFNWFRDVGDRLADPTKVLVDDIRDAVPGDPSPLNDGGRLQASRGIEVARIADLGTLYTSALDARYLDDQGYRHPLLMAHAQLNLSRLLMAIIEQHHDERGIRWPAAIAPFDLVLTPVRYEGTTKEATDALYAQLRAAGLDVLLDDRDARPGAKFADADLIGIPLRINLGDRSLKEGKVELKCREAEAPELIALGDVVACLRPSPSSLPLKSGH